MTIRIPPQPPMYSPDDEDPDPDLAIPCSVTETIVGLRLLIVRLRQDEGMAQAIDVLRSAVVYILRAARRLQLHPDTPTDDDQGADAAVPPTD